MEGSSVAKTKIWRVGLILKMVPLRSPTYRLPSSSKAMPGRNAHAFDEDGHVAVGRHLIDDAVEAAGDVEQSLAVEREAGGVHHVVDERPDVEVQIDLVDRTGTFCPRDPLKVV